MGKKSIEEATDTEYAIFLINYIRNSYTESKTGSNIRDFYIREAQRALPTFENPYARELLETEIKLYSSQSSKK